MLLSIKVYDVNDEDASKIINNVTKALTDIRKGKFHPKTDSTLSKFEPYMEYTFGPAPLEKTPVSESSTFSRYINATVKE